MNSQQPAYAVDVRRWPLVNVRPTAAVSDEKAALDLSYQHFDELLQREQPFVVSFDMRGGASSAARRQRLKAWTESHDPAMQAYVIAVAVIVGSSLERGFVTAALWFITTPFVTHVFAEDDAAEAWLLSEYAKRVTS